MADPPGRPVAIGFDIELTNRCNISCAMCPRSRLSRPMGIMERKTFLQVIEQIRRVQAHRPCRGVWFSGSGDCLLHPSLPEWVALVKKMLRTPVGITTNGLALTPERLHALTAAGLDALTLSVHTLEGNHTEIIRGATFREVLERVRMVLSEVGGTLQPVVNCVVSRLNKNEKAAFEQFWRGEGVQHIEFVPCHSRGGQLTDPGVVDLPALKPQECNVFLPQQFIAWNGDLLACCSDLAGATRLGNIHSDVLEDILEKKEDIGNPKGRFEYCGGCYDSLPDDASLQGRRAVRRVLVLVDALWVSQPWGGWKWRSLSIRSRKLSCVRVSSSPPHRITVLKQALSDIHRAISLEDADAVFCSEEEGLILNFVGRKRGVPPVGLVVYGVEPSQRRLAALAQWVRHHYGEDPLDDFLRDARVSWCCPTSSLRRALLSRGVPREHIFHVPATTSFQSLCEPGFEQCFSQEEPSPGLGPHPVAGAIIAAGNMGRDYALLAEAARKVRHPIHVVCDVEHMMREMGAEGKRQAEALLASQDVLTLHQPVPLRTYIGYLKSAAAIVVPLARGPFICGQMTISAAMRLGKAVVSADLPASKALVHHMRDGILYKAGDAEDLARSLRRLVTDATLARNLGRAAKARENTLSARAGERFEDAVLRSVACRDGRGEA